MTRALFLVAAAALLAGCGGELGPAGPALQETSSKLGSIETAVLRQSVRIEPRRGPAFGFELEGPVELAAAGKLPRADVEYRQFVGEKEERVRLVLTGEAGFVQRGDRRTALTAAQVAELRASASLLAQDGLETLNLEDWIVDPELSDGPNGTDRVTGELDVLAAMTGLASLSGLLEGTRTLSAADRKRVAARIQESRFELLTGDDDRLLRKLSLGFAIDEKVPDDLRAALGEEAVGAKFTFNLELDDLNQPVTIGE